MVLSTLLLCFTESETDGVTKQCHEGIFGGHDAWKETEYQILGAGFYWQKLFAQIGAKVRSYIPC